jgi:hypothetical protein
MHLGCRVAAECGFLAIELKNIRAIPRSKSHRSAVALASAGK